MQTFQQIKDDLDSKAFGKKINKREPQAIFIAQYERAKSLNLIDQDISLEQAALYAAGYNSGKSRTGEIAQIKMLHQKFVMKPMPKNPGLYIVGDDNQPELKIKKIKKPPTEMKSLDALSTDRRYFHQPIFFFLKTIDSSSYSKSIGGGHQDNVKAEIYNLIKLVENKTVSYESKTKTDEKIKLAIIIDGRSAHKIIDQYSQRAQSASSIIFVGTSEQFINTFK